MVRANSFDSGGSASRSENSWANSYEIELASYGRVDVTSHCYLSQHPGYRRRSAYLNLSLIAVCARNHAYDHQWSFNEASKCFAHAMTRLSHAAGSTCKGIV